MRIGIGIGINRGRRGGAAKGPVNTVAPEVTGTAERGEELSCSTGTWTGTGTITYAYQWYRSGALIIGATNSTYTLVGADDNAQMSCAVTATDDEGSRVAFSNAVGPVLGAPLNLTAPVLSGVETVGEELSVTDGTWQGVATITFAYQWRRGGVNISGATSSTYTLVAADYDAVIDCVVTATNSLDSASADSNDTGAIAGLAPTNDVAPSISGNDGLGDVLTRTAGTWSGVPTPSIAGQWRRNGVAIPGETGTTYTIVAADSGAAIDYLETATNAEGSATADSNNITVQTFAAPTNDVAPSIAGNTGLGDTLTRTAGTWSGNPTPSLTGQWLRNGSPIAGETGTTYTIVLADDNAEITYRETATNAVGSAQATSLATQIDDFTAPTNDVAPSITGNDPATIGDTLTRVQGTWSGNPTPTLTGEWYRNNVATGNTSTTYTITAADDNGFIFYRETATNAVGSNTADSAAITVEDFTIPVITGTPTIAGTEEVGETLTATPAAATGNPSPTTSWQWQRSADGSTGWADISGATSSTYTLVSADETNYIRVKQIETNALGSDEAVSAATGEITAPGGVDFRIVVNTANAGASNSDQFEFTRAVGDYDVEVYDQTGTTLLETITGLSDAATITIAAGSGIYELRVFPAATNGFNRIQFANTGDRLKLIEVRNWGEVVWSSMAVAFRGCVNLTSITSFVTPNFTSVTSFSSFADGCTNLTTLDISNWDTSNVTDFSFFVRNCRSLTTLDVSSWNTSSVTSFFAFANSCSSLTTLDVSGWNTSSVTNFSFFANSCSSLTTLDVSGWNTSSVTNFSSFANSCSSLTTLDVSGWNTSSVTNFSSFANSCSSLTDIIGIEGFNISSVTNFSLFLVGVTLPTSRYDDLLINYEAQAPNTGLNFHGGNSKYTAGGVAARTSLATTYNWTITDGGPV